MRKTILLFSCIFGLLISIQSSAQSDLDNLLKGSQADANYLAQGYMEPALNAIGGGLAQGWYNTAGPHKKWGFDLTFSVSSIQFPGSELTYHVDNSKLTTLNIISPTNGMAPTIIGSDASPVYDYKATPGNPFDGPPGINIQDLPLGGLPVPMVNLGLGIPWETELKFRFGTYSGSGGTKFNLFGVAVVHDIKQHIPGIKLAPFDLSAFVGYTTMSTEVGFDSANPSQIGKSDFSATTIQGLIGKKFSVLTLYGGLGYNFSSGSFKVLGSFPDSTTGATLVDPLNLSSSISGPRATAGLRLKLAIFTFHGDYTFQRYNTLTVGFGFSVR